MPHPKTDFSYSNANLNPKTKPIAWVSYKECSRLENKNATPKSFRMRKYANQKYFAQKMLLLSVRCMH